MKIWLDSTNLEMIKKVAEFGFLYGVTTNPSILAASEKSVEHTLREILDNQDGPVTVQVVAQDVPGMIQQGKDFYDFSDRIIVKIPVTQEGLEAIRALTLLEIPTMATVIFHPLQGLLAALAGAQYAAPYLSQIEKNGKDPWEVLRSMIAMFSHYKLETQILAASINTLEQITKCAEMGIPHITLKESVFSQLIETNPMTKERVNHFASTWEQSKRELLPSVSKASQW